MKFWSLFFIVLFSCRNFEQKAEQKAISEAAYPKEVIELNLQKMHDDIRWSMYCIYADESIVFDKSYGVSDNPPASSLELRYKGLKQFADTTELYFSFYYRDTIECIHTAIREPRIASGAGFVNGRDTIQYFTSTSTLIRFWSGNPASRYNNPLQPEVIDYIKSNKRKLHPWFYGEAKKRGIIK